MRKGLFIVLILRWRGFFMLMSNGWIKLHRKIIEWEWWNDHNTLKLFMYLLLMANHKDGRWQGIEVKRGQFITGRIKLAKELKLSVQQIRSSINKLKSTSEITIKATNKYSVITIVNYNTYNCADSTCQPAHQPANHPTSNQQVTTNKNVKKEKKEYSPNSIEYKIADFLYSLILKRNPGHKKPNLITWANHVNKMIHLDKRNTSDIQNVIKWCQQDKFWKNNILSTSKLRDKYDQLTLQMNGNQQNEGVVF